MNLGKYSKAIVAVLGTVSLVLADNVFSVPDVVDIVLAALTALGVYAVKNVPQQARPEE